MKLNTELGIEMDVFLLNYVFIKQEMNLNKNIHGSKLCILVFQSVQAHLLIKKLQLLSS